ncbi:hypothetical protein [Plantactinospora sp. WMMB782]|uniref:hypothetical protein n=1 Tax=Plantactinospora sp. WMMB782 TaxID=3404121 RepID=UPI003B95BA6D
MKDRISVPELLAIPAGTRIAWWIEFAAFADSLAAVQRHPGSVDWHTIDRVADDDTHVIVTIGDNEWAIDKRHHVVIDTGTVA